MDSKAKYVKVYGILDQHQGDQVYQSISQSISKGKTTFVVDLEHVPLIDNVGLSLLITALKIVRHAGGELYLTAVSRSAQAFLESKCLHNLFKIRGRSLALCAA